MVASLKGPQRRLSLAEGHLGGLAGFAILEAFLAALGKPVLHRPSVANLSQGDATNHHDICLGELLVQLYQYRQHNRFQIRPPGQDLLTAGR